MVTFLIIHDTSFIHSFLDSLLHLSQCPSPVMDPTKTLQEDGQKEDGGCETSTFKREVLRE